MTRATQLMGVGYYEVEVIQVFFGQRRLFNIRIRLD